MMTNLPSNDEITRFDGTVRLMQLIRSLRSRQSRHTASENDGKLYSLQLVFILQKKRRHYTGCPGLPGSRRSTNSGGKAGANR
jgi:hypothetical protein